MATPFKNFTDPTGLSAMTASVPMVQPGLPSLGFGLLAWMPFTFIPWAMVLPGALARPLTAGMVPRIPIPPMGRQILLTFPPIYRERGGNAIGQLYPPRNPPKPTR